MLDLIRIPIAGTDVLAVDLDGKPHIILRPAIDALGLDYSSQAAKLRNKSWASVVEIATQLPGDSQRRNVSAVDVRTFLMLLATVSENKIRPELRPILAAYQSEVADAIEAYFTKGGAINPNASVEQLDNLGAELGHIRQRAEIVQALRGVVAKDYLDAKGRILLGQAMGEVPTIDPEKHPLYVQDYLKGRGVTGSELKAISGQFGRLMRAAFFAEYGDQPEKAPQEIGGRFIDVYAYTEQHRFLFDRVWIKHFAGSVAA